MSGARRRGRLPFALLAGALLAGCAGAGPAEVEGGGGAEGLARARARWEATGLDDYRYTLARNCFCIGSAVGPAVVTVVDGTVTSVVRQGEGEPADAELYPSVEGLFDVVEDALRRDAHEVDVTYDPATGVPVHIWIDYVEMAVDEELGFEAGLPTPLG